MNGPSVMVDVESTMVESMNTFYGYVPYMDTIFYFLNFYTGFLHVWYNIIPWILYHTSFYYISLGVSFGAGIGRITNS